MQRVILVRGGEDTIIRDIINSVSTEGSLAERGIQQCMAVAKRIEGIEDICGYRLFSCVLVTERQSTQIIG